MVLAHGGGTPKTSVPYLHLYRAAMTNAEKMEALVELAGTAWCGPSIICRLLRTIGDGKAISFSMGICPSQTSKQFFLF